MESTSESSLSVHTRNSAGQARLTLNTAPALASTRAEAVMAGAEGTMRADEVAMEVDVVIMRAVADIVEAVTINHRNLIAIPSLVNRFDSLAEIRLIDIEVSRLVLMRPVWSLSSIRHGSFTGFDGPIDAHVLMEYSQRLHATAKE